LSSSDESPEVLNTRAFPFPFDFAHSCKTEGGMLWRVAGE
jgi:hypothetical protein